MRHLVIDIETTGLSPFTDRLHGISACADGITTGYYPAGEIPEWVIEALADPAVIKVGHNVRFDLTFLAHNGYKIAGPIHDTLLMSLLVDDTLESHGLKELTRHYFGGDKLAEKGELDLKLAELKMKHVGELCRLDLDDATRPYRNLIARYAREDAIGTWRLYTKLTADLKKLDQELRDKGASKTPLTYFVDEMVPCEGHLLALEVAGIRTEPGILTSLKQACETEKEQLLKQMFDLIAAEAAEIQCELIDEVCAGYTREETKQRVRDNPAKYGCVFNPKSGHHLARVIYDKLNCPAGLIKRTKSGARSCKEDHLSMIQAATEPGSKLSQFLAVLGDLKKVQKTLSTYVGDGQRGITSLLHTKPDGTTWIYPSYKQRTLTGRLSCFPIQQLPKAYKNAHAAKIKKLFVPSTSENCFIYADLSQIELRNAAHLSQDPALLDAYRTGKDLHRQTAAAVFQVAESAISPEQRNVGKTLNFLLLYGGSAGRLMQELALKNQLNFSKPQCEKFRERFFTAYSGYAAYLESVKQAAERDGHVVAENGRIRRVPDIQLGKYLDQTKRVFFGPSELRQSLVKPGERTYGEELYWRAGGRHRHALNAAFNAGNQSLGGSYAKAVISQLVEAGFLLRGTVHDSFIVEVPRSEARQAAERVRKIMECAYPLSVPVKADVKILNSFDEADVCVVG